MPACMDAVARSSQTRCTGISLSLFFFFFIFNQKPEKMRVKIPTYMWARPESDFGSEINGYGSLNS